MATQVEIQAVADRIKVVKDAGKLSFRKVQILNLLVEHTTYLQIIRKLGASETHIGKSIKQMRLQFNVPESTCIDKVAKRLEERSTLIAGWLLYKKQTARARTYA